MEVVTRLAGREQAGVIASAAAGDEIAFKQLIATHLVAEQRRARI